MARGAARNSKSDEPRKRKKRKRKPQKTKVATHGKDGKPLSAAMRAGIRKRKATLKRRAEAAKTEKELKARGAPVPKVPKVEKVRGKALDAAPEEVEAAPLVVAAPGPLAALAHVPHDPLLRTEDDEGKITWKVKDAELVGNAGLEFACFLFGWIENYVEIRTKEGQILQFRFNTAQLILAQFVARQWGRALPIKLMLPKSRQQGSSTFWQILMFALCELKGGYRCMVVAHDEAGAGAVFSRAFTALRRLRVNAGWEDPSLIVEQASHLVWETESSMQSGTIKTGDAIGRGGTLNACHFSETANFTDRGTNAKGAVAAVMNSVNDDRWTIIVHESTAKGKDSYFFPKCEDAKDPASGSVFSLIFLPWFLTPEYSMPWEQYRQEIVASGKPDPGRAFKPTVAEGKLRNTLARVRVKAGQESWRYRVVLTPEQLVWRRWAIANKCENDEDQFKREYPSTYEEAFTASAACFFKPHVIDWYRTNAVEAEHRGYLHAAYGSPAFQSEADGVLSIWELPDEHEDYVIGADTGGENENSDPYSAYVVKKETCEVVAHLHGHFEWDSFSDQVFLLGMFYGEALAVIENNHRPAVAKRLHRKQYPNLFYYYEQDYRKTKAGRAPGWNMNVKTRKDVLAVLKRALRTMLATIPDPGFWREMETFVWIPKANAKDRNAGGSEGIYAAPQSQHDDRIISLGLALTQCELPDYDPNQKAKGPPVQMTAALRWFLNLQADEEAERAGEALILGVPVE